MPLIYRGGGHLEPPTRALLSVGVVRLGVDAVIPIRRGRQRWRVGVGRVRRREPEGIPEEGIDPEAECRAHESETAEEAEPVEAVEALVAAAEPAAMELVATELAPVKLAVLEPGPAAVMEPAPTTAMEYRHAAAVKPGPAAPVES